MHVPGGGVVKWELTAQDDVDGTAVLHEDNTLTQDNVGGDINISCRPPSPFDFPPDVFANGSTCTATDEAGNKATATFIVNTED
jgi:hypothetical protein